MKVKQLARSRQGVQRLWGMVAAGGAVEAVAGARAVCLFASVSGWVIGAGFRISDPRDLEGSTVIRQ